MSAPLDRAFVIHTFLLDMSASDSIYDEITNHLALPDPVHQTCIAIAGASRRIVMMRLGRRIATWAIANGFNVVIESTCQRTACMWETMMPQLKRGERFLRSPVIEGQQMLLIMEDMVSVSDDTIANVTIRFTDEAWAEANLVYSLK